MDLDELMLHLELPGVSGKYYVRIYSPSGYITDNYLIFNWKNTKHFCHLNLLIRIIIFTVVVYSKNRTVGLWVLHNYHEIIIHNVCKL